MVQGSASLPGRFTAVYYPMEPTEPKNLYALDDSLKATSASSTFVKSDHLK
jgi:hypothetical protein